MYDILLYTSPVNEAVAYIRVSTEGQAEEGVSLQAQETKLNAWASFTDTELVAIHRDAGISGKRSDNRPAVQAAIKEACQRKCPLVVYSLSRLSRSVKDTLLITEQLDRAGADLVSLSEDLNTTTAAGRLVFRMLSVLAEFERDQLAERTKTAMAHLRDQGRRISGRVPYGYDLADDDRHLVENDTEQSVIHRMADLRATGLSYQAIAEGLNADGIPPKTGDTWAGNTVRRILLRFMNGKAAA